MCIFDQTCGLEMCAEGVYVCFVCVCVHELAMRVFVSPPLQCLIATADGWITVTSQSAAPSTPGCTHMCVFTLFWFLQDTRL